MHYYPCELHCHTIESDGSMTPKKLVQRAKERGLAAIALTDHNTVSGVVKTARLCRAAGLVFLRGIEWTTFYGHVVVLGGKSTVDWRSVNLQTIDEKLRKAAADGDALILAHPKRMGTPICCGCHLDFDVTAWDAVSGVEVWSNTMPDTNYQNVLFYPVWRKLLDEGKHLTTTYGYDWHGADTDCAAYACTYLGVSGKLTAGGMLSAIKNGRSYIACGVTLDLKLTNGHGHKVQLGDTIHPGHINVCVQVGEGFAQYTEKYSPLPRFVRICGTAVTPTVLPLKEGKADYGAVQLKAGYFIIEVVGALSNEPEVKLAITSPVYVENDIGDN